MARVAPLLYSGAHGFGARSQTVTAQILEELSRTPRYYRFLETEYFRALFPEHVGLATYWYWYEMLQRLHLAAATSLIRSHEWLTGSIQAHSDGNRMALAACFRGLLESAGDIFDALNAAAVTVAELGPMIDRAFTGKSEFFQSNDLENALIHFQFARKIQKGEHAPSSHQAKHIRDYLDPLVKGNPNIRHLYSDLCDITHPGASSVLAFTREEADHSLQLSLSTVKQKASDLSKRFSEDMMYIISMSTNPGLLALWVLNAFPQAELYTPGLEHLTFDDIPAGRRIRQALRRLDSGRSTSAE